MSIQKKYFGTDGIGRDMYLFTLTNKNGASITVTDFGAHLVGVCVPDRNGLLDDVVLGYDTLAEYDSGPSYLGATVGRFCNRIGKARFSLNGTEYTLFKNDGENTLHGGREGFDKKWFKADLLESDGEDSVIFTYIAHDGEEGYPGKLHFQVSYTWNDKDEMTIRYMAETDKPTVVNFTNHAFFNLNGHKSGDMLLHTLQVTADTMTAVDEGLIPTGDFVELTGHAMDLREPRTILSVVQAADREPPVKQVNGIDFNYCVPGSGMRKCAELASEQSGRKLIIESDEPAIQIYTGQGLDVKGKDGAYYKAFAGVAMETQHYPDSPNHPEFPTTTLNPGETFRSTTKYTFTR